MISSKKTRDMADTRSPLDPRCVGGNPRDSDMTHETESVMGSKDKRIIHWSGNVWY